jgi:hypothetical protein
MATLKELPLREPMCTVFDFEAITLATPPECSFNAIEYGLTSLHGQYSSLFSQIVKTLTHPENRVNAYFESIVNSRLVEIDTQLENAQGDYRESLLEAREKEVGSTRNHDERTLLQHSLLVASCAMYIAQFGSDPLQSAIFLRKKIEFVPDEFLREDPLILICALAHDIGKISAYKTYYRSLEDHDIKGHQIVSRLPAYMQTGELSKEDRFILDNVLAHYHAPQKVTVGHRIDSAVKTHSYSLSNRMHRILEITIAADQMAGLIEARAPLLRSQNLLNPLSDEEWSALAGGASLFNVPTTTSNPLSSEFEQQIVEAFHESVASETTLFNPADPLDSTALGFTQSDIEFTKNLIFIKVDVVIRLIEQALGDIPHDNKVKFVTEILSKNLAIHNPLTFNGSTSKGNFGGTLAWFVRLYPRDEIILTKDGFNSLRGSYLQSQQARSDKEGPYYCIDLANAPALYENKFKGIGRHAWDHYAMIVDGLGQGIVCAWGSGKGQLIKDRKVIMEGGHVTGMTDSAEDELNRVATHLAVKEIEIDVESDFLIQPPLAVEINTLPLILSLDKSRLVKSLISTGKVGKGAKSDALALREHGINIEELLALSSDEQQSLGMSVVNNEIRFLR